MADNLNLINLITKSDVRANENPVKPDVVNASQLGDLCPRYHYYANKHKDQYLCSSIIGSTLDITFEMGRALEHAFRRKFLEQYPIQKVFANWLITPERPIVNPSMTLQQWNHERQRHELCELGLGTDRDSLDTFREVRLSNIVVGRIDWIYLDTNNRLTVTELKTISKDKFEKLKEPISNHSVQSLSYVRNLYDDPRVKALGLSVNLFSKVFYTCKDYRLRSAEDRETKASAMYKEFQIFYADNKELMRERWDTAKEAIQAVKTDTIPRERMCPTYLKGRAKSCPFSCRCFMGD